ncbi:unnamed protein product [Didymodactylos carnosus]|uniref:Uncharacterized protein n=1 Tax=Didymodactylos carnosus TaxID=1234261 RepID=A0A8S2TLV5_9BILA|nr:unnamed protein product [Didymodactylos carnosus]CAF4295326.1 unnamed protein product [Didymodactylos carnosus]
MRYCVTCKETNRAIGLCPKDKLFRCYIDIETQAETRFVIQSLHMKVPSLGVGRGIPPIWLSLRDQVIIIFIIIFLKNFVYPRVTIKIETRFIVGIVCATLMSSFTENVQVRQYN